MQSARWLTAPQPVPTRAVVCGFGRVGATVCAALADADVEFTVIDDQAENVRGMRDRGIAAVLGDAAQPLVLDQAGIASARLIVIAIPDALDARAALDHASAAAPDAIVVARTHSMTERDALTERGAARVFIGEIELARAIAHASLDALEVDRERADAIVAALAP